MILPIIFLIFPQYVMSSFSGSVFSEDSPISTITQPPRRLQSVVVPQFSVNTNDAGTDPGARITLFSGGVVAFWQSMRTDSSGNREVLYRRIKSDGSFLDSVPLKVDPTDTLNQTNPKFCSLQNGGFVILWLGVNSQTSKRAVFAQIFDNTGAPSGNKISVDSDGSLSQYDQSDNSGEGVADGGFAITWMNGTSILFQVYYANGTRRGPQIVGYEGEEVPIKPQITGLVNGYIVLIASFGGDMVGKVYTTHLELKVDSFPINTATPASGQLLRPSPDGFLVVYTAPDPNGDGTGLNNIYGQVFDFDANYLDSEVCLHTAASNSDVSPYVIVLNDYCFFITFDTGADSSTRTVNMVKYNQIGELLTTSPIQVNSPADGSFGLRGSKIPGGNNFIVIWTVKTGSTYDIKAAIYSHGTENFNFIRNTLTIKQNQSKAMQTYEINTIGGGSYTYTVQFLVYGYFSLSSAITTPVTTFTQQNINDGLLYFTHDGSREPPFYFLSCTDGTNTEQTQVSVTFKYMPTFTKNSFRIQANTQVLVATSNIDGEVADDITPVYTVNSNISCYFASQASPLIPITTFTATNITSLQVVFVVGNTTTAPLYSLSMVDGDGASVSSNGVVEFFLTLTLKVAKLVINQGDSILLTTNILDVGVDPQLTATYIIVQTTAGYFASTANKLIRYKTFTRNDILNGLITYFHDNSFYPPMIQFLVNDGLATLEDVSMTVQFTPLFNITSNIMIVNDNETVNLTTKLLTIVCYSSCSYGSIQIYPYNMSYCKFMMYERETNSFTYKDVVNGLVTFVHDGSGRTPAYSLIIGNENSIAAADEALITFNDKNPPPLITENYIAINQGEKYILDQYSLFGIDGINSDFRFTVSQIDNAMFTYSNDSSKEIDQFTQSDILANRVVLIHDGSTTAPFCMVRIATLSGYTDDKEFTLSIVFNTIPQLISNYLEVNQGEKTFLSSVDLNAYDAESDNDNLIYYVTQVLYGQFENVNFPGVPINIFYQGDVTKNRILFFHDGSSSTPSYQISVSDGQIKTSPNSVVAELLILTGICGLEETILVPLEMLVGIQQTTKGEYIFGYLFKGQVVVINANNPTNASVVTAATLDLFKLYQIRNLKEGHLDSNTKILYILSETHTLVAVNVTVPTKPAFLGSVGNHNLTVKDFYFCGNYIYIAGLDQGIHIIDRENAKNMTYNKTFQIPSYQNISSLDCYNSYLFVTSQDSSNFMTMSIVDPLNPSFLATANLSDIPNYMATNSKRTRAYIAHNSGVDIISLANPMSPTKNSTVSVSEPVLHLDTTSDDKYMTVITENKVYIINIANLTNPMLLESLTYEYGLNRPLFQKMSSYGLIASTHGLVIFNIFQGKKNYMSPDLEVYESNSTSALEQPTQQILATPDGVYYLLNTIYKGKQSLLIYDSTKNQKLIKTVDLTCTTFDSFGMKLTQSGKKVIVTNCGNVTSISLNPIRAAAKGKTFALDGAWGLAVSQDGNYKFVIDRENKKMYIVQTVNNNYIQLATLSFNESQVPGMAEVSRSNNYLFVILEGTGLSFIDVSIKMTPKVVSLSQEIGFLGDARSIIYFSSTDGGEYLAVSLFYEGLIKIISVKTPLKPSVVASIYVGKGLFGLGLFSNKNYLAAQSSKRVSVLEIRNITNPVIVSNIANDAIQNTYLIGITKNYLILPNYQIFSLYPGKTYYYPSLNAVTSSLGQKLFYSKLFPIDPSTMDKTQETCKLILVNTVGSFPYWLSVDYTENYLTIAPPAMQSLTSLRKIVITFGSQISEEELKTISNDTQEVIRVLLFDNYIDTSLIPTGLIIPSEGINLQIETNLSNVSIARIGPVLSSHLNYQYLTFTLQDYIDLDMEPVEGLINIQTQWDNMIGKAKVNQRVDFQLMESTFSDPDNDNLNYNAYNLPNFMQFSASNLKFYGTPTKTDLGSYSITVVVDDGYKNKKQTLSFSVTNYAPDAIPAAAQNFNLGDTFDYTFAPTTFADKDGDTLKYAAKLVLSNGSLKAIPNWLNLDESRIRLYGKPSVNDIAKDDENKRFYQEFAINMTATDICDQVGWFIFHITCQNYYPQLNEELLLTTQFTSKYGSYIKINQKVDFEFSASTFTDKEDTLTYTVVNMPHWLQFTGRVFYGTTSKIDLGDYNITVIASDGLSRVNDTLFISVQNHQPTATPIWSPVVLIYGHSLQLSLGTPFSDPDNDPLSYFAYEYFPDNDTLAGYPIWIQWDSINLRMAGTPGPDHVPFNETLKGYFKNYSICVAAVDAGDLTAFVNFTLLVANLPPTINKKKPLSQQFSNWDVQVQVASEKQFDDDTFIDLYNDTVSYQAELVSEEAPPGFKLKRVLAASSSASKTSTSSSASTSKKSLNSLPQWMKFDAENRRFSVNPTSDVLNYHYVIRVIANNSRLNNSDTFSFDVKISINYAFSLFLTIIGAVGGAVGFLVYRKTIYAILGKKLYCYPLYQKVKIGEKFKKTIYLIKKDLTLAQRVWKELKKKDKNVYKLFENENPEKTLQDQIQPIITAMSSKGQLDPNIDFDCLRFTEIFMGFLVLETMDHHKEAKKIFNAVINHNMSKKGKEWYYEFVTIKHPTLNVNSLRPFPTVDVHEDHLIESINSIPKPKFKKYLEMPELDKKLIKAGVKAHVLGIIHPSSRMDSFMEYSRGESILIDWEHLAAVQIRPDKFGTKYVHGSLFDIPTKTKAGAAKTWFTHKIEKGVLIFTGTPSKADVGKFVVRIFDPSDVIIREFGVRVFDPNAKSVEEIDSKFAGIGMFMNSPLMASMGMDSVKNKLEGLKKQAMDEKQKLLDLATPNTVALKGGLSATSSPKKKPAIKKKAPLKVEMTATSSPKKPPQKKKAPLKKLPPKTTQSRDNSPDIINESPLPNKTGLSPTKMKPKPRDQSAPMTLRKEGSPPARDVSPQPLKGPAQTGGIKKIPPPTNKPINKPKSTSPNRSPQEKGPVDPLKKAPMQKTPPLKPLGVDTPLQKISGFAPTEKKPVASPTGKKPVAGTTGKKPVAGAPGQKKTGTATTTTKKATGTGAAPKKPAGTATKGQTTAAKGKPTTATKGKAPAKKTTAKKPAATKGKTQQRGRSKEAKGGKDEEKEELEVDVDVDIDVEEEEKEEVEDEEQNEEEEQNEDEEQGEDQEEEEEQGEEENEEENEEGENDEEEEENNEEEEEEEDNNNDDD